MVLLGTAPARFTFILAFTQAPKTHELSHTDRCYGWTLTSWRRLRGATSRMPRLPFLLFLVRAPTLTSTMGQCANSATRLFSLWAQAHVLLERSQGHLLFMHDIHHWSPGSDLSRQCLLHGMTVTFSSSFACACERLASWHCERRA